VHPQEDHTRPHLFEFSVGPAPIKRGTDSLRDLLAVGLFVRCDDPADLLDVALTKITSAPFPA